MSRNAPSSESQEVERLLMLIRQLEGESKFDPIEQLGLHKSEEARAALIRLTRDEDYWVRFAANEALSKTGDSRAEVDRLLLLLEQSQGTDKCDPIRRLGLHKSDKARDALAPLTQDEDLQVRLAAGEALAKMGDFSILAAWLGEEDHQVSYRAAESLVENGLDAIPILVEGLKDDRKWDASVWGIIIPLLEHSRSLFDESALRQVLRPAVPILIEWITQWHIERSSSPLGLRVNRAVDALGRIGDPSALPALETLLTRVTAALGGDTVKEYVADSKTAGYVSSDSAIASIQEAIENIVRQSP